MIFIPIKWVPYLLIVLGIMGTIVVAMKGEGADKVFGIVVCVLAAIGGIVWAVINIKKSKHVKK